MNFDAARATACVTLLAAGTLLVIRAAAGPFHLLVTIGSPLVLEGVCTLILFACLVSRSVEGSQTKDPAPSGLLLGVLLLTAVCFAPSLKDYFLSDDFQMLDFYRRYAPTLPATWAFTQSSSGGFFFRPVASVASSVMHAWAGESALRWHAADLAVHLINCALVYFVALGLLRDRAKAAWSAALFGIFPASPEAVSWPAGGHDTLIATLFVLAAVWLYLMWLEHGRAAWLTASLVACALALGSKEIAFTLPLMIAAMAWHRGARMRSAIPFFVLAVAAFAYRWWILKGAGGYGLVHATALGSAKALLARLWTVLTFPLNWSGNAGVRMTIGLAVAVAGFAVLTFSRPRRRDLALSAVWILLFAAPAIQMLLIGPDLLNARHLYLPAAGFAMLLGGAIEDLPKHRWAAGAALLVFYIATLERNLAIRARVSEMARQTCIAAAHGAGPTQPPAIIDGIWAFSNGFDVCVEMQKPIPSAPHRPD